MFKITLLFLLSITLYAIPTHSPYPGGIIVYPIQSTQKPLAFHDKRTLMVRYFDKNWHVIAGIHLLEEKKFFDITLQIKDVNKTISIPIQAKTYKKQYITVKNTQHVSPNHDNLDRIWSEKKRSTKALQTFSKRQHDFDFIKPVSSKIDDDFGKRRYFNNKPRKPHSGVDMKAKIGTKIKAPLSGTITISDNFFFNGNTIYIDHGEGLVSMVCHLNKRFFKEGDTVRQGDIIGEVGMTGRATGPHLHWGVALNGNMIDPRLLL
jgi:murein DD-endopeptidase MepM/ murein hydrolase activator NlpD